jgi:hypothetical protein
MTVEPTYPITSESQGRAIYKNYKPLELSQEQIEAFADLIAKRQPSVREQLKSLKSQLSSTDYQIIKCYEYSLVGMELPYDVEILHEEREAIREQIRELENTN